MSFCDAKFSSDGVYYMDGIAYDFMLDTGIGKKDLRTNHQ
jgi:hypothetical protein